MRILKKEILWGGWAATAGLCSTLLAGVPGDAVVVIYNSRLPESKELAGYYVQRREVPTNQVFGFDLPVTETMTRGEFRDPVLRRAGEDPGRAQLERAGRRKGPR